MNAWSEGSFLKIKEKFLGDQGEVPWRSRRSSLKIKEIEAVVEGQDDSVCWMIESIGSGNKKLLEAQ